MVQRYNRLGTKKLIWAGIASGLLIAFCWIVFYAGSALAFSSEMPKLTPEAITPTVKPIPQVILVYTPSAAQSNPQDNIVVTILIALLSGSVGAIIGSVIQARINNKGLMTATEKQTQSLFQATEKQIKSLYEQEKDNRLYNEKQQEKTRIYAEAQQDKTMRQALLIEVQENLNIAQTWGGNYFIYLLGTEAWAIYKGNIKELPESLQSKLLQAYTEIRRYNSMAEFFKFNSSAPKESMNNQSKQVINACQLVIEELSKE